MKSSASSHSPEKENSPVASNPPASPANPPRLAIQRLRLENFKSYGGCVDVGPFHKSFSSIVGPNGSGKSNVIDAMLFVFGRRAKQLRHSKLSELLHHSDTHPDVQSATVTVYFHEIVDTGDGDDDYRVVSGSEFAVARRAFRNNTSKYYLDDKEVKMGNVVELLKSKGVDLDNNRFLILQGEVEQIAMMKPKSISAHEDGLLEYLEDIIGSNRHIRAIEESSIKVETLNEERGHKLNRVKAAERERDALEGAKVEAEDYLDKEREMLGKKITLGKAQQFDCDKSLQINTAKLAEASEKMESFRSEVKEKENSLKELEKSFKETQKQSDVAVKTMNEAKDKYTSFERKDIQLREDIKALKSRAKKMLATVTRETKRAEESSTKAKECLQEKADAEESVRKLEQVLEKAQRKFDRVRDAVREKTAPTRQKLEEKQTALLPFSETVNQCRKDLQVNQSELKLLVEKLEAPLKNLQVAEKNLQELEAASREADASASTLAAEATELSTGVSQRHSQIQQKRSILRELSASCSAMRRQIEEARSASEDVNTRSRLHNGILDAAKNGVLHGVVGRLGDLASVDPRYTAAISAAAGSSLDCIVVHTAENAQECIQFLRRENLGRATFVIIDKISYLRNSIDGWAQSGRTGDGPRLFDYLQIPNPQNRTALYYAVRDTLVADTLEDARRMAFKPTRLNRVVSLSGELIESSGAMSGGGRGPSRYKLGASTASEAQIDPSTLRNLNVKFDDAKRQIEVEESSLRDLENQNGIAIARQEEVQVLIAKAELESNSLKTRKSYMAQTTLPTLKKAVADSSATIKAGNCPDTARQAVLEQKVKESEKQVESAREACAELERKISSLQEEIVAAGGSELRDAKDAVEQCRSDMSNLQSCTAKASSRAAAAEKARENALAAVNDAEKTIEDTKTSIEQLKAQSESMLDDAEQTLLTFKETESIHKEWTQKLQEVQGEYTKLKDALKRLRREEVSLSDSVAEVRRLVDHDKAELRALRSREKSMVAKVNELSLVSVDMPVAEQGTEDGVGPEVCEKENADEESARLGDPDSGDAMDTSTLEAERRDALADAQLPRSDQKHLAMEIGVLESELAKLSPNLSAIGEYQNKSTEYKSQVNELDTLTSTRDSARRDCDSLRKARLDEFMAGFSVITLKLKELYQMITLGGDAELELVDSLDPFSEGIVFSVRPPKKSWKNISNLSGGEKTLSSLALVFALHHFKPTPLYFLDEIDAALDYKNVSIVANYVKERTKNAQFIIISLRNNMFELADRLVGIYKTFHTTKSVTVDPSAFVMPSIRKADVPA